VGHQGLQGNLVLEGLMATLEVQDLWDPKAHLVREDLLDRRDLLVLGVKLVSRAKQGHQVHQANRDHLDLRERQGSVDLQAHLDPWDLRAQLEREVSLELLERVDQEEKLVYKDLQDRRDPLELLDLWDPLGSLDQEDQEVHPVQWGPRENQVLQDFQV